VPGDRLALAVLIGREEQLVDALQRVAQLLDDRLLARMDHVGGLELVVDVDRQALRLQVTDVAHRRLHDEVAPEVARDRAGLGRRLDDDQGPSHE
jgi:hypothetical protein